MSDLPRKKSPLDALVAEAKQDLQPRVPDAAWAALEDRIVSRMAEERSPLVDEVRAASSNTRRATVLRIGAVVLAAAAAFAVVARDPGGALLDRVPAPPPTELTELTGGSLRSTEGPGEVRVGGQPAPVGHVVRAGDLVEAVGGARAILERPRKVMWLLERGQDDATGAGQVARARIKSAGEALILGLEDGAVEAQVTPVPSGEAFAVDIASGTHLVRVAVHGTHLRVTRSGSRVVVDLNEGVVSIGVPPRTGSTYGTLVTAPSHVEFDAADLDGTLRVDHSPAAVRAAISLAPREPVAAARPAPADTQVAPTVAPPVALATVPRPAPALPRSVVDPSRVEPSPPASPAAPALPPRAAIAAAVRDCAAARSRPENVRVTVSSSLKLKINASGDVETAQFDPPLLPEIQACAAAAIYKAKLEDAAGASVSIPIDFSY